MITQVRDGVLGPGLKALEQRFGPVGGRHGARWGRPRWGKADELYPRR